MPPLQGFSDNEFRDREDLVRATESLLQPLIPYLSKKSARIKIPVTSGAHFDENAAQLEGYARPLWAVAALLAAPGHSSRRPMLQPWIDGLREGVDPSSPEYWGAIGDWDQRMVEAEIISFALLAAPETFYSPLPWRSKELLARWLRGLNGKVMPVNNWRWFRVLTNLALIKVCGTPRNELLSYMEEDLETLETFYIGEGWAADGPWRPGPKSEEEEGSGSNTALGRHADYYSGSFAIQFSQLIYSKFASDFDPDRAELFRDRARKFCTKFWMYFDSDGASIPFGRSLTYRFAMGAFYAAFAYADLCDDSDDMSSHGAVKGMLLRHLRWWSKNSKDIFSQDGTLNIGYLYPNMYMSEDYNSPQSPYWALKSMIVAALSQDHPFWTAQESPHPLVPDAAGAHEERLGINLIRPARHLLCHHPSGKHHFLLSSGQFAVWPMKATQAKYSKFAYSSSFGFSVPTGNLITQIAPDSTLALSNDSEESWATRWTSIGETSFIDVPVHSSKSTSYNLKTLVSRWRPWRSRPVEVTTTLIPPCDQWPDWHVRIHHIRNWYDQLTEVASFACVEGGFAIDSCRASDGRSLWNFRARVASGTPLGTCGIVQEGAIETPTSSLVLSKAGVSAVVDISPSTVSKHLTSAGEVLKPDPNTNLMATRTLLPTVRRRGKGPPTDEFVIATAVFAISFKDQPMTMEQIETRWAGVPKVAWGRDGNFSLG